MFLAPTCIENMHINLPKCLIVLPGAVASKGVHLVTHGHSSMVDSPRPSFKVHRPAQHSTRKHLCDCQSLVHHFATCLDFIRSMPLKPATKVQEQQQRCVRKQEGKPWGPIRERTNCAPDKVSSAVSGKLQYLNWESILRGD